MQAAITGATGFIGSHLTDALLAQGWKVRILKHRRPSHRKEVESLEGRIDLIDDLIPFCEGADLIFHLASAMGSAQIKARDFQRINLDGTRGLLEAARITRVPRVVHVSSAGVLGAVPEGVIADETFAPKPVTLYDKTKYLAEKLAVEASSYLNIVVVRPGWVYGPRDRRTFKLIRAIKKKRFLMVGPGQGRQSPVWVSDLVQGLLLAAARGKAGAIYNLAAGEILTIKEMVTVIAAALGARLWPGSLPVWLAKISAFFLDQLGRLSRREMPLNSSRLSFFLHSKPLSISRAKEELGFAPQVLFRSGIPKAIRWYQEQGWL